MDSRSYTGAWYLPRAPNSERGIFLMLNPFESVEIGTTGVSVTRLGLGGAPLSGMELPNSLFGGTSYDNAIELIRRTYQAGVRYFDTAPLYGEGRSENRYAAALKEFASESYSLSTKVGRLLVPRDPQDLEPRSDDRIPRYKIQFDYSRDGVARSLTESLERLGLGAVDILYVHDHDFSGQFPENTFEEALAATVDLRSDGIVKAIGMGMNECESTGRMIERYDLDIVLLAGRYTLLDQTALPNLLPLCLERGVQLAIGGPYNSGILARDLNESATFDYKEAPPEILEKARRIRNVCERHSVDLRAAALQFPFAHPAVATIVPGAKSIDELEDNIRLMQQEIPSDLWSDLKSEDLLPADVPTP